MPRAIRTGVALALWGVLVLASIASAGYFHRSDWNNMTRNERMAYVAGFTDAINAINSRGYTGEGLPIAIGKADRCSDGMSLGKVTDLAERSVASETSQNFPAFAILRGLIACEDQ